MYIAIDTETTGLNFYLGARAFAISWKPEQLDSCCAILPGPEVLPLMSLVAAGGHEYIGHNLPFDIPFLEERNIALDGPLHDTMVMAHLYNSAEPSKRLKDLAKKYIGRENTEEQKLEEWFCSHNMRALDSRKYDKLPDELVIPYAKADVEMTMELFQFYKDKGVLDNKVYRLEQAMIRTIVEIVRCGMRVNKSYVREQARHCTELVLGLIQRIKTEFQIENPGSEDELAELLFKRAGIVCVTHTPKGNICLDAAALQRYEHPIIPLIKEYRELTKMNSTYLQPMLECTDENDRLHASIHQVGARTGRMSASNPNLTNIPRTDSCINIRKGFIPKDGHVLVLLDLSQIELRILAHYCKEPIMLDTLCSREGDLHSATAKLLFQSAEKSYRTVAKTLNFATIYGGGAARLAQSLNDAVPERKFTVDEAKTFKATYFRSYPKLQEFIWAVQNKVRAKGYVFDAFGRHHQCEPDKAYKGVNYLIQGCAASVFKTSAVNIVKFLRDKRSKLINLIHDEFIIEMPKDELCLIPDLVRIVEDFNQFRVPIYANAAWSTISWADKQDITRAEMAELLRTLERQQLDRQILSA